MLGNHFFDMTLKTQMTKKKDRLAVITIKNCCAAIDTIKK